MSGALKEGKTYLRGTEKKQLFHTREGDNTPDVLKLICSRCFHDSYFAGLAKLPHLAEDRPSAGGKSNIFKPGLW